MFVMNDDLSIYATRGDIVFFSVSAKDGNMTYKFQPGDIVRMSIYGKKEADECVMQKDFPVSEVCEEVFIFLAEEDTKIGDIISKHKDYWYEIVLNPDTMPQTIIGYDENGAKIFRLFPESAEFDDGYEPEPEDFPVVDEELDMTSPRPVANRAIARAVTTILDTCERTNAAVAKLYVTPEMFGAIGDGVADDTEAIQTALNSGKPVICNGNYALTVPLVIPSEASFTCYGTLYYKGDECAIWLGCGKSKIYIKKIVSTSNGVRVSKNFSDPFAWVAYNQVEVQEMECEGHCLYMVENSIPDDAAVEYNGVMYNTFTLSTWRSNAANCVHIDNTVSGNGDNSLFFNENTFIGGLIGSKSGYAVHLKSTKQSDFASSLVSMNKFYGTSFEGSVNGVYLCNASENSFMDNRYEGNEIVVKLSEMSWDNTFKSNTEFDVKKVSSEELIKNDANLHKNIFDCVLRLGASARVGYRGYVFGANLWSVEPAKQIPITINNTTPSVVLEEFVDMTSGYQFAECRTFVMAQATNSVLQLSAMYDNQEFDGLHIRLNGGCTLTVNNHAGEQLFALTNYGEAVMSAHFKQYNGRWRQDA